MAQVVGSVEAGLAEAACSGDAQALDALVTECLPLVYAIVRRSLGASSDVDDVVQDVMLNVVRGLGSLRDPDRLRAWLAAVTVNQIRAYLRSGRAEFAVAADRYEPFEAADPASEFVGHTLLRLDLSRQRRETARAADWLDPEHRDLLGLWWLEASGHLSRADLVAALRLDPHHVTVRIGRMKEQLDGCRRLLRALDAGCVELTELASDWRGETSSVWRKRFIRHIRVCRRCLAAADGLIAPERLLAGLALPALPLASFGPGWVGAGSGSTASGASSGTSGTSGASGASGVPGASSTDSDITRARGHQPQTRSTPHRHARHRAGSHGGSGGARGTSRTGVKTLLAKPLVLAAATLSVLGVAAAVVLITRPVTTTSIPQSASTGQAVTAASALASAGSVVIPSAPTSQSSASASPSPSRAPRHSASPTTPATHAAAPATSSSSGSGGAQSPAEQVLAVINRARASAGLAPYKMSTDLIKSATAHDNLMAGGCGLSHQCPGEAAIGDRETAAGVQWTACGENIGEGGPEPHTDAGMAAMAVNLTNSMLAEKPPNDGHRRNILSSSFTEVGIAVTIDSSGTVWLTQDFAN